MPPPMPRAPFTVCPWVTPKIFPRLEDPFPQVEAFFDHYARFFAPFDQIVLNFCTGNGDHLLNYAGPAHLDEAFDWARYNCYVHTPEVAMAHNRHWLEKVYEGGEVSSGPYTSGPSFILSEERMTYRKLQTIYDAFRTVARRRGLNLKLLEYLEPGPEFCQCIWKTARHPEGAPGLANAGGTWLQGVIDVCATLRGDRHAYAAYPNGIPEGLNCGTFCAAQSAAFARDFGLDGIFLGNQFALLGLWRPEAAPPPDPVRRADIRAFFHELRRQMGDRMVYWMDTYWPVHTEIDAWQMSEENYAQLDAVMISNFAVLAERTQILPNLESRLALSTKFDHRIQTLFSLDFVDAWYTYRVHLDMKRDWLFQREIFKHHGHRTDGVSFFANDTFGHFIPPAPLEQTLEVIQSAAAQRR